jgi:hypothetical protein
MSRFQADVVRIGSPAAKSMCTSMSVIAGLSAPGAPDALGQIVGGDGETRCIPGRLSEGTQPVQKPESLKHGSVNADADCMVAFFDPLQRRTAREGPLGDRSRRQPPPATGVADIGAELGKRSAHRYRRPVRTWHIVTPVLHKINLM